MLSETSSELQEQEKIETFENFPACLEKGGKWAYSGDWNYGHLSDLCAKEISTE